MISLVALGSSRQRVAGEKATCFLYSRRQSRCSKLSATGRARDTGTHSSSTCTSVATGPEGDAITPCHGLGQKLCKATVLCYVIQPRVPNWRPSSMVPGWATGPTDPLFLHACMQVPELVGSHRHRSLPDCLLGATDALLQGGCISCITIYQLVKLRGTITRSE